MCSHLERYHRGLWDAVESALEIDLLLNVLHEDMN